MRPPLLGPPVELPMGPRNAVLGVATHVDTPTGTFGATKRCTGRGRRTRYPHWGLTWSSL
eukprot:9036158-Pyramimonas_sp.AAC.1